MFGIDLCADGNQSSVTTTNRRVTRNGSAVAARSRPTNNSSTEQTKGKQRKSKTAKLAQAAASMKTSLRKKAVKKANAVTSPDNRAAQAKTKPRKKK